MDTSCGIDGNEEVDKVARQAIGNPIMGLRSYFLLIYAHKKLKPLQFFED